MKRKSPGFQDWAHFQGPGTAGWENACLESPQCTLTEVIYYILHRATYLFLCHEICLWKGAHVCPWTEGTILICFLTNNVGDWPYRVPSEGVGSWRPKGWTRKCLTPSHYRTHFGTYLFYLFILPCPLFLWGFCCWGGNGDSLKTKHLFKGKYSLLPILCQLNGFSRIFPSVGCQGRQR